MTTKTTRPTAIQNGVIIQTFDPGQTFKLNLGRAKRNPYLLNRFGSEATFRCLGMDHAPRTVLLMTGHKNEVLVKVLTGHEAGKMDRISTAYITPITSA